jgi:hypothetical protein
VEEFYDFEHDPWERSNLAGSEAFRSVLSQYRNLLERPVPAGRR